MTLPVDELLAARLLASDPDQWTDGMFQDPDLLPLARALSRQARIDGWNAIPARVGVLVVEPGLMDAIADYSMTAWSTAWEILAFQQFQRENYDFVIVGRIVAALLADLTLDELIVRSKGWRTLRENDAHRTLWPLDRLGRGAVVLIHQLPEQLRRKTEALFAESGSFEERILIELRTHLSRDERSTE